MNWSCAEEALGEVVDDHPQWGAGWEGTRPSGHEEIKRLEIKVQFQKGQEYKENDKSAGHLGHKPHGT